MEMLKKGIYACDNTQPIKPAQDELAMIMVRYIYHAHLCHLDRSREFPPIIFLRKASLHPLSSHSLQSCLKEKNYEFAFILAKLKFFQLSCLRFG